MYAYGAVRAPMALLDLQNSSSQANSALAFDGVFFSGEYVYIKKTKQNKTDYNQ